MRHGLTWFVITAGLVGLAPTPRALGQGESPAALRQDAQTLRLEVESLSARLAELQARHDAALAEIERLRKVIAARGDLPGDPTVPPPQPPDEATPPPTETDTDRWSDLVDPLASPESLFVALSVSYSETIWDKAPAEALAGRRGGWLPDTGDVRAWAESVPGLFEGQTEWLTRLRFMPPPDTGGPRRALVTVLHPSTLHPISEPFAVEIPDRFVARINNETSKAKAEGGPLLWRLLVTVRPEPVFDAARDRAGPFNYPRFIGPFAGFDFDVRIRGVGAITEAEARKRASDADQEEGKPRR